MRIGHGYDAHRFGADRPLILGGIEVAYEVGLIAHSDGDVVLHALCDALLGAAALGDIGRHFPDTDAEFKDIDSRELLRRTHAAVRDTGLRAANVDLTVLAQAPKLRPYIDSMRALIAEDLQLAVGQVNVKATTTEGMGFVGQKEGIATHAVVLLDER